MTTTSRGPLGWPQPRHEAAFPGPSTARPQSPLGWPSPLGAEPGVGWLTRSTEESVVSRETTPEGEDVENPVDDDSDHLAAVATDPADDHGDVSRETGSALNAGATVSDGDVSRETVATDPPSTNGSDPSMRPEVVGESRHGAPQATHGWSGTRIMTVANQKGGVGKTTSTVNIAAAMAQAGLRVLVIDMDPQGNASTALSIPHLSGTAGIYDVLIDGLPLEEVVRESPHVRGLLGAPATIDLAGAEIELVPLVARENRLRRALTAYLESRHEDERIDLVLIDCPPSLGLLTVNAFVAAREVLIPIQCEYYALEGLSQLLKNVELIQQHLNSDLRISTILLTMADARTRLSSDVAAQVREYFGPRVLRAAIPHSVRISEAPSHGETVITYDPSSTGALSYVEAAAEMRQQQEVAV